MKKRLPTPFPVAVIGSGLIGRSWAMVFARAGHRVTIWDTDAAVVRTARAAIEDALRELRRFDAHLPGRHRCLVAHPVNPPHIVPVVEVSPAPWTAPDVVSRTLTLHEQIGQVPVLVKKEVPGFVVNRLQAALLMEAWRLVQEDCCSVEDLDKCLKDGLGLRWAFMGPFETIDLNAPGGLADYARRYGPVFHEALRGTHHEPWDDALIAKVESQRRAVLDQSQLSARAAWRDRRLMALIAHKRAMRGSEPD